MHACAEAGRSSRQKVLVGSAPTGPGTHEQALLGNAGSVLSVAYAQSLREVGEGRDVESGKVRLDGYQRRLIGKKGTVIDRTK